ncbi:MAG: molybdopterin-dependent oxidoreductase, partial [Gammaproteobacteria bacterium]|nr:molybdopterin-dependent oxidoreductase [Gammaproteobacteria bacterium]
KNGQIKRVIGRENIDINDQWISDRDRYSFEGLTSDDRLSKPQIKKDGQWTEASWDDALQFAVDGLKNIIEESDGTQVGTICSPSATTEEMYLLQKMMRGIGSNNIDHRLRQTDFSGQSSDPLFPGLGMKVSDIANQQAALLIGSNIRKEQPILGHQLRQASLKGAQISVLNSVDYDQIFDVAQSFIVVPSQMFKELKVLAKATVEKSGKDAPDGLGALISAVKVSDEHKQAIEQLFAAENSVVILGTIAQSMPHYAAIQMLASFIAQASNSTLSYLTAGANTSGAYLSGLTPHSNETTGLNTQAMFSEGLKGYILYGIEAEFDLENPVQANNALSNADFVVSMTSYVTEAMKENSDVLLPIAAVTEASGTLINVDGTMQSFSALSKAHGMSKPGWKVLRVMGNLFDIDGFDYQSSEDVINELSAQHKVQDGRIESNKAMNQIDWNCPENISSQATGSKLQRIAELPIYRVDAITRRATSLQETQDGQVAFARINSALAKKLKLENDQSVTAKQGDNSAQVTVSIDDRVSDNCVYLPAGIAAASSLGGGFDSIELVSTLD